MLKLLILVTFFVGAAASAEPIYFDARVPLSVRLTFQADLDFVRGIRGNGASPRHRAMIGLVSGDAYLAFLKERIQYIAYHQSTEGRISAYVQPPYHSTMYLASNLTNYGAPQLYRVQVYWHEARHGEWTAGNWPHAICPKGATDLKGKEIRGTISGLSLIGHPGCDSVTDGAYGLGATMMGNLVRFCTNCNEKVKADAEWLRDDSTGRLLGESLRKTILEDLK